MASGYEKAACGVDPNQGWGTPTPAERVIVLLIGIAGTALFIVPKVTFIARVVADIAG